MSFLSQKGITAGVTFLCLLFFSVAAPAQNSAGSVEGFVRDAQKQPVAGAKVWLDDQVEGRTQATASDSTGHFIFRQLAPGSYRVRAQKTGFREATQGPIALKPGETSIQNVQLTAEQSAAPDSTKNATQGMDYSDEPKFTVAGVSDPSNVGGHGSNVTLPTKEALAKDTASLAKESPSAPENGATNPPAELPKVAADDFAGNLAAGRNLIRSGRPKEAIAYLERALELQPDAFDAHYCLAEAYLQTGNPKRAEELANQGPPGKQTADGHALLAEILEAEGHAVAAAKQFEAAAAMEPTEAHLFSWGAELLLHHAYEPAAEVFAKGHRLYPGSVRMLVGLGAAAYARDLHDEAARWLLQAIALDPSDPKPYEFLGKVQEIAKSEPQAWVDAFQRFAALQPDNPRAHYFHAVALEKLHRGEADFAARERELTLALKLDAGFGDAYLHLGLLQTEKRDYPGAVASLQKAIEYTPLPDEAHLRLAQVYREMGETGKAHAESQLYTEVSAKKKEQLERERRELGQFVYTMQGDTAKKP